MSDILIRGCNDHLLNVLKNNTDCEVLILPPHGDLISREQAFRMMLDRGYQKEAAGVILEVPSVIPSNKEDKP